LNSQPFPPLISPVFNNSFASRGAHSGPKAVSFAPFSVLGLVGPLHVCSCMAPLGASFESMGYYSLLFFLVSRAMPHYLRRPQSRQTPPDPFLVPGSTGAPDIGIASLAVQLKVLHVVDIQKRLLCSRRPARLLCALIPCYNSFDRSLW
ncbi:hypothetical protein HKBW3S09_01510, partial [Candidatus Hakubella thermalkaliphila]